MKNGTGSSNQSNNSDESLILYRNSTQEVTTDTLQVNRKKVYFGNTVYQTSSIAGFSAATIKNKFPRIWTLSIILFFFINKNPLIIKLLPDSLLTSNILNIIHLVLDISLIILLLTIILVWTLVKDRYGLLIISNSGLKSSIAVIHENKQFIHSVVQTLTSNIDNDYHNAYRIDFSTSKITQV